MQIKELKNRKTFDTEKIRKGYEQFNNLLTELRKQSLQEKSIQYINSEIDLIDGIRLSDKSLRKQVRKSQAKIIRFIEKEEKIAPKNYYRNMWLALGMSAFGIPLGAAFGTSIGNVGFLGVGIPIGMAIGAAVGTKKDKQTATAGRQLDIQLKHY